MTIIQQTLIQKSQAIFGQFDKWNAFNELHYLHREIVEHWLMIGAKRLQQYFEQKPSSGWRCDRWDDVISTQWYLERFGLGSLAIGYRWGWQFHLHLRDSNRFNSKLIDQQLTNVKYARLLEPFGVDRKLGAGNDSKVMESYRDFTFGSPSDGNTPPDELAWYAANRTDDYIKQAAGKVERFTRDTEMTRLLSELNNEAQMLTAN